MLVKNVSTLLSETGLKYEWQYKLGCQIDSVIGHYGVEKVKT